jgi:hypothetical protein
MNAPINGFVVHKEKKDHGTQRKIDGKLKPDTKAILLDVSRSEADRSCEQLAAVLRGWPVREIERDVRLSSPQRVAFYELVTASLKAADTLGGACPAETALTPVGRMETMRKRLTAVRAPRSCASTRRSTRGRR